MTSRHQDPTGPRPLDPAVSAMLEVRGDGAALRRVLDAVPTTDAAPSAAQREAAWAALSARMYDPSRVPFSDEVPAPLALVRDESPLSVSVKTPSAPSPWWQRAAVAATLVLAVGLGSTWANGSVVYEQAAGSQPRQHALADGSTTWLAPGSRLTVSRRFGWPSWLAPRTRAVALDGEAYFEVQRDGRRFVVTTADSLQVQVLGTRFSVRGAHNGASGRVEVSEGRVAVLAGRARVELAAGEGVSVHDARLRTFTVNTGQVAAWRTGGLAAIDEPLGGVLAELARRFGVAIDVEPSVDVSPTVSLFYADAPAIDVILADLCTAQGLRFEKTSRGFRVVAP